jgi:hypothetical protein
MRRLWLLLVLSLTLTTNPIFASSASASKVPVPACTSDQLQVLDSQWLAAAGNGAMAFDVVNSGASCRLEGYPSVAFFDAKGRAVDKRDFHNSSSMTFAEPRDSIVTLARGGVATFGVSFSDNPVNNDSCPEAASAVVQLHGGVGSFWGEFRIGLSPCGGGLLVTPIELGAWPRPNG